VNNKHQIHTYDIRSSSDYLQVEVFWVVKSCSVAAGYQQFGGSVSLFRVK